MLFPLIAGLQADLLLAVNIVLLAVVSPGFEFEDFELANATALANAYPQHKAIIYELCR